MEKDLCKVPFYVLNYQDANVLTLNVRKAHSYVKDCPGVSTQRPNNTLKDIQTPKDNVSCCFK